MRPLLSLRPATLIIIVLSCAAVTSPATAAPIVECGNYGARDDGSFGWGSTSISGAGIYNVTTRNVACAKARRFVRRYRGTDTFYPAWHCREMNDYEFSNIRCTASRGRVVHWQTGA
jgi:hypothetical protein